MRNYSKWNLLRWILLLAATLSVISIGTITVKHKRRYADMTNAQQDLQYMYEVYNEEYFDNKLPKDTKVIYTTPIPDAMAQGETFKIGDSYVIWIDAHYDNSMGVASETELHEMCHVKLPWDIPDGIDGHGPKFQACMHNLADQGAFEGLW